MEKIISFENMHSFSVDQQILFLENVIMSEMEKSPDKIDFDLVDECSLLILELEELTPCSKTEEKLKEESEKIIGEFKNHNKGSDIISKKEASKEDLPKKRISFKKLFIVAATIFVVSVGSTMPIVADDPEVSRGQIFLGKHIKDIAPGETISKDNQTLTRADRGTSYLSAQQMVTSENMKGFYSPKNFQIDHVIYSVYGQEIDIVIRPKDRKSVFSISVDSKDKCGLAYDVPAYTKITMANGLDVWIHDKGEKMVNVGRYQLMFKINDWYYTVSSASPKIGLELVNTFVEVVPIEDMNVLDDETEE